MAENSKDSDSSTVTVSVKGRYVGQNASLTRILSYAKGIMKKFNSYRVYQDTALNLTFEQVF